MADDRSRLPGYGGTGGPAYAQPYLAGPVQIPPFQYGMPAVPAAQYGANQGKSGYPSPSTYGQAGANPTSSAYGPYVSPAGYGYGGVPGTTSGGDLSMGVGGKAQPPPLLGQDPLQEHDGGPHEHAGVYQDVWAAVLFLIHLLGVVIAAAVLGGKGMNKISEDAGTGADASTAPPSRGSRNDVRVKDIVPQLAVVVLIGFVFAWIWLMLTRAFPKAMVKIALWGGVVITATAAVILLLFGKRLIGYAIIFAVIAIIQAVYAYMVRKRIPFAAALLSKVTSVIRKNHGVFFVSYGSAFVSVAWFAIWIFGAAGAFTLKSAGIVVFLLLVSLYWTSQVVQNVVHVTVSGTVATYYFQQHNMPESPTRNALGRALTKSFGSICFGSLIVAIIQAIRTMVRAAANRDGGDGMNPFVACCALCILNFIDWLVQYFNKFAYVQVAIYGKSFIRASKDTWDLFKSSGVEALINDDLTGNVLGMGMLLDGVICAVCAGVWTNSVNSDIAIFVALLAFFIGILMASLLLQVVDSGVVTYYVCFAEDPAALSRNDPEFFQILQQRRDQARQ